MKTFHLFTCIALSLLLLYACQPETDLASVNAAKVFFENQASTLSLPLIDVPQTKSTDLLEMAQSVYPVWEKAITSEVDGRTIVEVPLSGAVKVVGAIVTIKEGHYNINRATCNSYLVLEYVEKDPILYIETFLQKGNRCTMTAASNRDKEEGFRILSDLDGHVFESTGFQNGLVRSVSNRHHIIDITRIKNVDYFGFRFAYAITDTATKGGCPGYEENILCPNCLNSFWGNPGDPGLVCPFCSYEFSTNGDQICPTCEKPLDQCVCQNPAGTCPPCGQLLDDCDSNCSSSPDCPCDSGLH